MPHGQPQVRHAANTGATPVPTTGETVAATLADIGTSSAGDPVDLEGAVNITAGTGATTITVRIRRGGVTGPVVRQNAAVTLAAGQTATIPVQASDSPGEVSGQQYVLTVQQAGATGNGTVNQADLRAEF